MHKTFALGPICSSRYQYILMQICKMGQLEKNIYVLHLHTYSRANFALSTLFIRCKSLKKFIFSILNLFGCQLIIHVYNNQVVCHSNFLASQCVACQCIARTEKYADYIDMQVLTYLKFSSAVLQFSCTFRYICISWFKCHPLYQNIRGRENEKQRGACFIYLYNM